MQILFFNLYCECDQQSSVPVILQFHKPQKSWLILPFFLLLAECLPAQTPAGSRTRISLNEGWRFMRYTGTPDNLIYDVRPVVNDRNDNIVADARPTEAITLAAGDSVLKRWILPTANNFIKDPARHHRRPAGDPGSDFPLVQQAFNDADWQPVTLPHDWAIQGPFYEAADAVIGGGMGRLPVQGVAWYRRKLDIPVGDKQKNIYLDIDGAMSYAMVWINGHLAGGWPYGYNSFRIDLTPYIIPGGGNQLAIRLDNPAHSARWYPGAGLYRNVWLTKVQPLHIAQWGSFISSRNVSATAATLDLQLELENSSGTTLRADIQTDIFTFDPLLNKAGMKAASLPAASITVATGEKSRWNGTEEIRNPFLWEPVPVKQQKMYMAVTRLLVNGKEVDRYETRFGIRDVQFDPLKGVLVNGKPIRIQGVNQHHDLGALGAAFNTRAAERQLEILASMGCNAIRLSHNPPAPELLDLTDRMGFLVIDEVFDCWERKKTPLDFHLIFPDWYEADTRSFIRRDRNHPSVIAWSFGNEVGEQYTADTGALLARKLYAIVKDEDPTRPATASMNYAKPDMPFPAMMDIINLNYQGEGIRDAPAYAHLRGIRTTPLYPAFKNKFPDKLILSSETSSALSTRGAYIFPVTPGISAPVSDSTGGDPVNKQVSAYELYTAQFGASPDKVFGSQDKHPFVAGEFVWSGWDYLGEPTPYYSARSSYSGIIDLAGFKKDRYYLYQSRWRSQFPMAHILPHWNWPDRIGAVTPVHVFTSGDEGELFLNGRSLGKKKKGAYEYRLRWDEVKYEPGVLKVIVYQKGKLWATDEVRTTGPAVKLQPQTDRRQLLANGTDLSFITIKVTDSAGRLVPDAANAIRFSVEGPADIPATDNGDPASLVSFVSKERNAYAGLALVIIRTRKGKPGKIIVHVTSPGLKSAIVELVSK